MGGRKDKSRKGKEEGGVRGGRQERERRGGKSGSRAEKEGDVRKT